MTVADAGAPDASAPDAAGPVTCDALQPRAGCGAGGRCAWVGLENGTGRGQCAPNGVVATGGACQVRTGEPDDCVAGSVCISGECKAVCTFGSGATACASGFACTRYTGLFANEDQEPAGGACNPLCDPLTQLQGTGQACPPGQGCYLLTNSTTTVGVCAGAGSVNVGQTLSAAVFVNSCVPGAQPRMIGEGSAGQECGALCRPANVTSTQNAGSEGGVAPYTCESRGAAPPESATAGESCRYWWSREPFEQLSPYSNTVGWCFKHAIFQYDTNGDQVPDTPYPRCINTTEGDVLPPIANPPHNDAEYFWCIARAVTPPPPPVPNSARPARPRVKDLYVHPTLFGGWRTAR